MKHHGGSTSRTRRFSAIGLLVVALGGGVAAQSHSSKRFMGGPLTLEDQGSFFIGGVAKVTEHAAAPFAPPGAPGAAPAAPGAAPAAPGAAPAAPGAAPAAPVPQQITIGQMYVQFQIPARRSGAGWPVIMVHGSTHTGAALESTPDGREGWYPYFVRKGVSTYVVDQSGRGRSGFDQSVLHEAEARMASGDVKGAAELIPNFGRITDNGAWTAWFGHLVPAGSTVLTGTLVPHGDAADPAPKSDPHAASLFPIDAVDTAIASRTGAIGPRPAGSLPSYALEYYKQLVPNAEVTLPGSTCATCNPSNLSPANTWTPQNLALLVERLGGAIVATHSQSGIMGHHMVRILKERGHLDLVKGLITVEGACSLPNSGLTAADFDTIPVSVGEGRLR